MNSSFLTSTMASSSRRRQLILFLIGSIGAMQITNLDRVSAKSSSSSSSSSSTVNDAQSAWRKYAESSPFNSIQDKKNSPWIDPDTPKDERKIFSYPRLANLNDEKREFDLVFSDEFMLDGRTMHDGRDPRWTALHSDDLTNNPLHWYSHTNVQTTNGVLNITLDVHPQNFTYRKPATKHHAARDINVTKEFRGGMVQSWNKFCFTGGIIEISAKLPGDPTVGGLWPAMWMMGNLARATYLDTSDYMWPFSTNSCNNRTRYAQEISACNSAPGYGMQPNRGRGAAEIDFLEVMFMDVLPAPLLSASLQIAPGKEFERPFLGQIPNVTWYRPVVKNGAGLNLYYFGAHTYDPNVTKAYQTDTVSINYWLDETFYERPHKYRIEWEPPADSMEDSPSPHSRGGYIKWFIDGKLISAIVGDDLKEVSDTEIPSEPMYLILNQALSKDWGFPDAFFLNCPKKCWSCIDPECRCAMPPHFCERNVPASFEIDYVRIYQVQNDTRHMLGCSPPSRPTAEWIEGHKERYTLWEDSNITGPLQPITRGGGVCVNDTNVTTSWKTCGGEDRGVCDPVMGCLCRAGWTGPHCLSAYGDAMVDMFEEYTSTSPPTAASHEEMSTVGVVLLYVMGTVSVIGLLVLAWNRWHLKDDKKGYQSIPNHTNGNSA